MRDAQSAEVVDAIRAGLRERADPDRAGWQQAYMKSAMPFLGVPVPETRAIARQHAKGVTDAATLRAAATELCDEAAHREERYAAMALLAAHPASDEPTVVPLIEHMVRTGQWWDITDELAHRIAGLLDRHPDQTSAVVRTWSVDDDFWMRRLAILSQLGRRDRVDPGLITDAIEPNTADREFFIRKAIGWALREYARVQPEWVRSFVAAHELSPLRAREALKRLS